MQDVFVQRIDTITKEEWKKVREDSRTEGMRFLTKLEREYGIGEETSAEKGEALFGCYHTNESLIAVGGIAQDPYAEDEFTGRIRRFYVAPDWRQRGIGSYLLMEMITYAGMYYEWLVLFADTERAARFYTAQGFLEAAEQYYTTHFMKI